MDKGSNNPLARLDRRTRNYPLIALSALLFLLLVSTAVLSSRDGDWIAAAVSVLSIGIFALVLLFDEAKNRRLAALDDRKFIEWDAAIPEIQRQNVNLEVRELARVLGMGEDQLPDLLSAYIVAADLALRQVQQEENLPLMRHVSIGGTPFDAIVVADDLVTCVEVAFLVRPDVRREKIESMLKKITQAKHNLAQMKSRLRLRLMLVLVTQLTLDEEEQLRAVLSTRRFSETPVDIDIRMLDFEMLQKVYVTEN